MPPRVAGLRIVGHGHHFEFGDKSRLTVGRTRQRDIRIRVHDDDDDRTVSRRHCVIDRLPDGRYRIQDWKSKNGVYIAQLGDYSEPVKVKSAILTLGMRIQLGNYQLAPFDEHGRCLILGTRVSEMLRGAQFLYGSEKQAGERLGLSRRVIGRLLDRLKEAKRARAARKAAKARKEKRS